MNKENLLRVLSAIKENTENDVTEFDGKPFTGRTVAEYFGNQAAAIVALSEILEELVKEIAPC